MNDANYSLVLFTVLAQGSVGMIVTSYLCFRLAGRGEMPHVRREWIMAGVLLLAGLTASLFHIGHPFGAAAALTHGATSWLSREVIAVCLFGALTAYTIVAMRKSLPASLMLGTAILGVVSLVVSGAAYAPPSLPALNNASPIVLFLLTAASIGLASKSFFGPKDDDGFVAQWLIFVLIASIAVRIILPSVWSSGGAVMMKTGQAWFASPVFWLHIVLLAAPIPFLLKSKALKPWMFVAVLAAELLGRLTFFVGTAATYQNIGHLF